MDNQHRVITGYRELSTEELTAINQVKALGAQCESLLDELNNHGEFDRRWLAIARTDLQTGLMAAVRAIARPTTF